MCVFVMLIWRACTSMQEWSVWYASLPLYRNREVQKKKKRFSGVLTQFVNRPLPPPSDSLHPVFSRWLVCIRAGRYHGSMERGCADPTVPSGRGSLVDALRCVEPYRYRLLRGKTKRVKLKFTNEPVTYHTTVVLMYAERAVFDGIVFDGIVFDGAHNFALFVSSFGPFIMESES